MPGGCFSSAEQLPLLLYLDLQSVAEPQRREDR